MRDDLLAARRPPAAPARKWTLRRILLAALGLFLLGLLAWWIYDAFIKSPEEKIREAIQAAARGARERNPGRVTVILSEDFQGPLGVGKDDVHRVMIRLLMREFRRVEVALAPDPIPVTLDAENPKAAQAQFSARVRGKYSEDSEWVEINPRAGGTRFLATFKETGKGWKMSRLSIEKE